MHLDDYTAPYHCTFKHHHHQDWFCLAPLDQLLAPPPTFAIFHLAHYEMKLRGCMDEVVEILRGIKSDGLGAREETEILDIRSDEVILLKKPHSPVSPNSVVDNWDNPSSVSNSF